MSTWIEINVSNKSAPASEEGKTKSHKHFSKPRRTEASPEPCVVKEDTGGLYSHRRRGLLPPSSREVSGRTDEGQMKSSKWQQNTEIPFSADALIWKAAPKCRGYGKLRAASNIFRRVVLFLIRLNPHERRGLPGVEIWSTASSIGKERESCDTGLKSLTSFS